MTPIDRDRIARAASALAGGPLDPTPARLDAWRQLHYAAQVASEVGKAWGAVQADDSHSSFGWEGEGLVGAWIPAARRFRAALRARDLELSLVDERGTALARRALDGVKLDPAMAWVRDAAQRAAGEPPRQAAVPAPDLPPHAVAGGAPFSVDPSAFDALAQMLAGASAVLADAAAQLGAGPVRVWPHHFDMATLAAIEERAGSAVKTIGVGLAPPDPTAAAGYWYVSPWAQREPAAPPRWPALAHGRWVERGGALRMAALPLDELAALRGGSPRADAIAGFLAGAIDAGRAGLDGPPGESAYSPSMR
ncbi:MAG TPA: hypothetical protein VMH82_09810 [Myxococcota bacterium]|nr:hypothetical protein [Myxococcota bacterium]